MTVRLALRRRKNLSRIENVLRIERLLKRAHELYFVRIARIGEIVALLEADAVLRRDRAVAAAQCAVDDLLDGAMRLGTAVADTRYEMQVAVAQMAEHHQGHGRPTRFQRIAHFGDIRLHPADDEADVEGEDRRVLSDLQDIVAQRPEPGTFVLGLRDRRIGDLAILY